MEKLHISQNENRLFAHSFSFIGKLPIGTRQEKKFTVTTRFGEMGTAEVLSTAFVSAGTISAAASLITFGDKASTEHLCRQGVEPGDSVSFLTLRWLKRNTASFTALIKDFAAHHQIDLASQQTFF